ncbi:alpha/beta hydrolase [Streptomyces sp. GMY02]|uniref:alpha/beta fold hydrolase n=1 Tax=Streptomyces sp. GMY02 TaxID=1333528 RepID=UPI001C2C101C|nr:alpha/beta hydrolase [Streptomyces sp. GMY02]QXE34559.1 alpha/beta hydrolase [Streptomyces sp. GMY02]
MTHVTVNDTQLFYTDEGQGDETLLLIHGGTCDSHDWAPQMAPFTARHRVVAVDLRGHGRSQEARTTHRPADYATDLALLVELLGTGPVIAVGHSLGALVASVLAVEHPELVRAVVAVDPSWGFEAAFAAATAKAFRTPDPVGVAAAVLSQMEGSGPGTPAWLGDWHRRRALAMSPDVVSGIFLGIFDLESEKTVRGRAEEYLLRRSCPVLTVGAAASLKAKGIDGYWDKSVSAHPYSESVVWDGVGHWLFQERPDEFNALLLDWIAEFPRQHRSTHRHR